MSRTSVVHRIMSLLCGVSFALLNLSTNADRPCPMHGSAGHEMPANASEGHANHHAPATPESVPHHSCRCATTCCSAPAIALLGALPRVAVAETGDIPAAAHEQRVAPATAREHQLPFAIGPPANMMNG